MTWYLSVCGAAELASVFLCLSNWSKKYLDGRYRPAGYGEFPPAAAAFFGYLFMGLIPIFGLAFLHGAWRLKKEKEAEAKAKELARVEKDVAGLLGG